MTHSKEINPSVAILLKAVFTIAESVGAFPALSAGFLISVMSFGGPKSMFVEIMFSLLVLAGIISLYVAIRLGWERSLWWFLLGVPSTLAGLAIYSGIVPLQLYI